MATYYERKEEIVAKYELVKNDINKFDYISIYLDFASKYGKSALLGLNGKDLLMRLFAPKDFSLEGLTYVLEHKIESQEFGGIKGGSAYKFFLFYSKEKSSWIKGTASKNAIEIEEIEAIEFAEKFRDDLVKILDYIDSASGFNTIEDYIELDKQIIHIDKNLYDRSWIGKYLHMLYPDYFSCFYNDEWKRKVIEFLCKTSVPGVYATNGLISLAAKDVGLDNYSFAHVLNLIMPNDAIVETIEDDSGEEIVKALNGFNKVVYGTPGCGKSFFVENSLLGSNNYTVNGVTYKGLGVKASNRFRTTFYQDYSNTDFVGQVMPKIEDGNVTYEFHPGPFSDALLSAIKDNEEPVALIIEELNRGNAASIFGDIFQLLDRDITGASRYHIVNNNIKNYINSKLKEEHKESLFIDNISIPSNLFIIATMNTSDQNVFTLDTAFKRRWKFEKLRNSFAEHTYKDYIVPGTDCRWEDFVNSINNFIISSSDVINGEDKQLGVYFVDSSMLLEPNENRDNKLKIKEFAYKVLEYLWDDVSKYSRNKWFKGFKSLDDLLEEYENKASEEKSLEVFADGIFGENE